MSREAFEQGKKLLDAGRLDEAHAVLSAPLRTDPTNISLLFLLGVTDYQRGEFDLAIQSFEKALDQKPDFAPALFNLGTIHMEQHRFEPAIQLLDKAHQYDPENYGTLQNLCSSLKAVGNEARAISLLERAVTRTKQNPVFVHGYGVFLTELGRISEAIPALRQAVSRAPEWGDAHLSLGAALALSQTPLDALPPLAKAISLAPKNPEPYFLQGNVQEKAGDLEGASDSYRAAIEADPDYTPAYINLGKIARDMGNTTGSIAIYQEAISRGLDSAEVSMNLGNSLQSAGLLADAEEALRRAIALEPLNPQAHVNLGNTRMLQGRADEALEAMRGGLKIDPGFAGGGTNYLMCLTYLPSTTEELLDEESRFWAYRYKYGATRTAWKNTPDPDRKLRVGYVSPDFRTHSVAYFFEPLLDQHDRDAFEVYCYANVARPDATTERLQDLSDHWRSIRELDDETAADLIARDEIDILIDLAGNRLGLFAIKPAPVQGTWLGYPGGTGLATMDFRITDALADPKGDADGYHVEDLERLEDGFLCYRPSPEAPPVVDPPCLTNGHITFGSFNNLAKLTSETIDDWAKILNTVSSSRLRLKCRSFACPKTSARIITAFEERGISNDRLTLLAETETHVAHLAEYGNVDIALDTYPYNGTTTTFEALWMGVPVVTSWGNRHAGRVGASILTRLGQPGWVAGSSKDYLDIAAALAADKAQLKERRSTLRRTLAESSLSDAAGFAGAVESVFRARWRAWCAG